MKVLVACDEWCFRVGDKFYLREFGHILLRRYLNVFEKVRFVVRTKNVKNDDLQAFNLPIEDDRIEVWPVPFFQGPAQYLKQYLNVSSVLERVGIGCEMAILRLPSTTAFAVWRQIKKKKIPCATEIVFDCHDGFVSSKNLIEKILWFFMHKQQQAICAKAIGVACVTEQYLQKHYYSKKKDVVLGSYSSIELPKSFYYHNRTCPIKDVFRIIHVANQITFDGRKGHKELIQLLKILTQKGYNVEVVFVGKDYQNGQGKLINYAKEHGMEKQVIFTGYLTQAQMREQMILADVAVLPTKAEGLPRVIIEAMAMGLPCITTNVSGNPELISSDFLVDYENVQEMSAKLIRLIENRHLYQSVSEENFEKSKKFSADLLNQKRRVFYSAIKQRVEKLY